MPGQTHSKLWVALIVQAFLFAGCGMCSNSIKSESRSPDWKLKAIVFERDCGSTTGANTQISILNANQALPDDGGNIFSEDANHDAAVSLKVDCEWKDNHTLLVRFDQKARTFKKLDSLDVNSEKIGIIYGAPRD
ncbi:MAG TPA: hypothetical protein V6C76_05960 [Drouetiella sp.]